MVVLRLDHRLNGRVSPSDILQEAYIDALKRVAHYLGKPSMSVLAWLRLVVGQRLVEVHRQHLGARMRNAAQELSLSGGAPSASSLCLAAQLVGNYTAPSQVALRHEWIAQLETALDGMDPVDREVLTLRHFEELSNNEVAEILDIHKAAASKRYVRALARLKQALEQIPGFFNEANS
jgi:RNA polymerase sigma-70 factor (ECF subfamily)